MTEKYLQRLFLVFLQHNNIYHFKTIACSRAGVPDIVACVKGKFMAFEIKSSTGNVSKLQEYNKQKIEQSGGDCFVVTPENYCTATDMIMEVLNG